MPEPHRLPDDLRGRPFTVAEALEQGVPGTRLRRSDLAAPFHAVRRPVEMSGWYSNCLAYAAKMPAAWTFSHITAARIHGIPLPARLEEDPRVHVTALGQRAPRGVGVAGHTTQRIPQVRLSKGVRVTSAVRTWTDLAPQLSLDELVIAGDRLLGIPTPLATVDDILREVGEHATRRGQRLLVHASGLVRPGSRSPRESRTRLALLRAGLPEPELNARIVLPRRTIHGDLVYRERRVLLEYEGDQHRTDSRQWSHDLGRYNDLAEAGWLVIRVSRATSDAEVVARAARALASGGRTP